MEIFFSISPHNNFINTEYDLFINCFIIFSYYKDAFMKKVELFIASNVINNAFNNDAFNNEIICMAIILIAWAVSSFVCD